MPARGHQRRTDDDVRTILISTTILFTSVSAVGLGIGAGYAAIWAILAAFGRRPAQEQAPLVGTETASFASH